MQFYQSFFKFFKSAFNSHTRLAWHYQIILEVIINLINFAVLAKYCLNLVPSSLSLPMSTILVVKVINIIQ